MTQHIMIDLGTGNNNKARALVAGRPSAALCADMISVQINWAMTDKQEFIDILEVVYRGARKGRGLVVSPKGVHWASALQSARLLAC